MIGYDIDLIDRKTLIMAIKGCEGADLVFYEYVNRGGFVYLRIGDGGNTYSLMLASTHCDLSGCSVKTYMTGAHLDCNNYKVSNKLQSATRSVSPSVSLGLILSLQMHYKRQL